MEGEQIIWEDQQQAQRPVERSTRKQKFDQQLKLQAHLAAFDAQQAQNKRISQGLGALAQGISNIDFSSPASSALTSQNQADSYKKWIEMQEALKKNPDALNFMPMMPYQIRSSNPELVSNAWANAGKTLATSALSGAGKMYGM